MESEMAVGTEAERVAEVNAEESMTTDWKDEGGDKTYLKNGSCICLRRFDGEGWVFDNFSFVT